MVNKLAPRLAQLKVLHKVFSTGVAEVPPDTRNVVRASHLLNTLYKAILEYDNVGEASEQTVCCVFALSEVTMKGQWIACHNSLLNEVSVMVYQTVQSFTVIFQIHGCRISFITKRSRRVKQEVKIPAWLI